LASTAFIVHPAFDRHIWTDLSLNECHCLSKEGSFAKRGIRVRSERPVLPSVLDRLIDLEPKMREDTAITRSQSIRELKASLQRDLEWLLNTRRIAGQLPESAEQLRNSLYCYGLPEFTELSRGSAPEVLAKHMESAIRAFEPRLANVRVSARPVEGLDRMAHFIIEAILLIDPVPERVAFDTALELTKGEYRVRGES
jgi:type VI secretion system protein ImpF